MSDQKTDLENRLVELEGDYLEREAILSQRIDLQQIEIDMLRRIKRQKKERIAKLEEALQNISNGDTPWMDSDGCHTTPVEIYQKYAKQVLAQQTKSPRFDNTYCSQCGSEFGPGEHGYSHCGDHVEEQDNE